MTPYRNLISESLLIGETIELLRSFGGKASASHVVDNVMKIRKPDPDMARKLAMDLVDRDPRLRMNDDTVELDNRLFDTRGLFETEFVVFDLETTGAKAPPCRITEIGAWRIRGGEITDKFHSLVNPQTPIPEFITALTGIDDDMVREAPLFSDLIDEFLEFIGDSVLVAHNAPFDMRFLNNEIGLVYEEYRLANPCLCTVQLSRKLLPGIQNHKLKTVAEHYSIPLVNHHRASDDARATAEIFVNLMQMLADRGIRSVAAAGRMGYRRGAYVR
jgi:DNA polymerase III epsilon subunit family exonuclease